MISYANEGDLDDDRVALMYARFFQCVHETKKKKKEEKEEEATKHELTLRKSGKCWAMIERIQRSSNMYTYKHTHTYTHVHVHVHNVHTRKFREGEWCDKGKNKR